MKADPSDEAATGGDGIATPRAPSARANGTANPSTKMANRKSAPVRFGSLKARPPLTGRRQRIGLLGGSFNPPHEAHVLISETARKRLNLDAVWWIVTPGNPLKSHSELAPQAERMAQCRTLAPQPWIKITGFEADLSSPYTAATLDFLKMRYPAVRFVWLMGADNLSSFHRWQDWRTIAATFPMAVIDRPTHRLRALAGPAAQAMRSNSVPEQRSRMLAMHKPPAWTLLTGRLSGLSSTELRKRRTSL